MPGKQSLTVWAFRVAFRTIGAVRFPVGKAANTLRGAIGTTLLDQSGLTRLRQLWFGSQTQISEPSIAQLGLADPPKAFLLRAAHLDGQCFDPGQSFDFDLILFEEPSALLPEFISAFRTWEHAGLGPTQGRVSIHSVINQFTETEDDTSGIQLNLSPPEPATAVTRLTLEFQTPTELKSRGEIVSIPEFPIVVRRLTERIRNLQNLFQNGASMPALPDRYPAEIFETALRQVEVERRSSRTSQRHGIGGFVGVVKYTGDFGPFIPLLKAGEWTGVGRQTVWGKGQYVMRPSF